MDTGKGAHAWYILLIVMAIALLCVIIWPFAGAFLMGSVLAGALHGWSEKLSHKLWGRRQIAAGILTVAVLLCLVLPIAGLTVISASALARGIRFTVEQIETGGGIESIVAALPPRIAVLAHRVFEFIPPEDIRRLSTEQSANAAMALGGVLVATWSAVLQTVLMLIALFFLLLDGHRLLDWLDDISPLRPGQLRALLREFRDVSRSVILSSLVTALVQTVVATAGYAIVRLPQLMFFTLMTFFFAFIPAIGAAGITILSALVMFLLGSPWSALFLALWGVLVVGLVDNVIKPLLIKHGMHMHGVVVFFSLIGGLVMFGAVGLIAGPLIVAFFVAVIRLARRELGEKRIITKKPAGDVVVDPKGG